MFLIEIPALIDSYCSLILTAAISSTIHQSEESSSLVTHSAEADGALEQEPPNSKIEVWILDKIHPSLPIPRFSEEERNTVAKKVYEFVWQRSTDPRAFEELPAA